MAWDQNSDILEAIRRISSFFLNLNFYDYLIYSLQKFLGPGARNGTHSKTPDQAPKIFCAAERTPDKTGAEQTLQKSHNEFKHLVNALLCCYFDFKVWTEIVFVQCAGRNVGSRKRL